MNKFAYNPPSNYRYHIDIYNDAFAECQKCCERITYDLRLASPFETIISSRRSKDRIIFESHSFENLIVIYCILTKAEQEAARR